MLSRRIIITSLIPTAFLALCLAVYLLGWNPIWTWLQIPTMFPPFADMRVVQGALDSVVNGFNPQVQNPGDPWGRPMNYPIIWLQLAAWLNMGDEIIFLLIVLFFLVSYTGICTYVAWRSQTLWPFLLYISFSSLLLIERGNTDLVMIAFLVPGLVWLPRYIGVALVTAAACLKIYPIFAFAALTRTRIILLASLIGTALAIPTFWAQIQVVRAATPTAFPISYGIPSMLALISEGRPYLDIGVALAVFAFGALLASKIEIEEKDEADGNLFVLGASIYLGTFLFSSNYDYRLAYLILTLPMLATQKSIWLRHALPFLFLIASNQNLLLNGLGTVGFMINIPIKIGISIFFAATLIKIILPRSKFLIFGSKPAQ